MKRQQTNEYHCTGEDGETYIVYEIADRVNTSTWGDRTHETEGRKELRLADGSAVNFLRENEFQIVSTGVKLKVND
jgi:hypothetical protein